jgi:5'-nucleotidase
LPRDTILNVNVPDVPLDQLQGVRSTRLGFRHRSEPVVKALDPKNRPVYWIGPAGAGQDAGPGTDFHAVATGFASVTPIKVDLTDHRALDQLGDWLVAWS